MGKRKPCICGHTKSSHSRKKKIKNKIIVSDKKGKCLLHSCGCKKYKRAK